MIAADDERFIRLAIAVAKRSRANGNHPFGAILVGPDGAVLMEAENSCMTTRDRTGHAERNLMTGASMRYDAQFLSRCTLYTSAEPCAMCSGAAYWAGVGRVVYGLSEARLKVLTGDDPENPTMTLDCRQVLSAGQHPIAVAGPLLEDEAAEPHAGFWR
jgi:tRNA(Arg) A34 adenosine deaminase TadA